MNINSTSRLSKTPSLIFLLEKMKNRTMYVSSMAVPEPLMVSTKVLLGRTKGRPYKVQTMHFNRVARYGAGE